MGDRWRWISYSYLWLSFCHGRGRGFESRRPRHSFEWFTKNLQKQAGSVLGPISIPVPANYSSLPNNRKERALRGYWIRFDLLPDSTPPGRMASTSFPCAKRLLFVVA